MMFATMLSNHFQYYIFFWLFSIRCYFYRMHVFNKWFKTLFKFCAYLFEMNKMQIVIKIIKWWFSVRLPCTEIILRWDLMLSALFNMMSSLKFQFSVSSFGNKFTTNNPIQYLWIWVTVTTVSHNLTVNR